MQLAEAATLDRKSGVAEGSAVRLSAFPNSWAKLRDFYGTTDLCEDGQPPTLFDLSDPHKNLIPFNTYRINCNPFLRVFSSPGRGIEGPGVPGTNQFAVFDHALGQRASPMGAFVVQGADDAIDICNAKCP
jgi:hypothetical protein